MRKLKDKSKNFMKVAQTRAGQPLSRGGKEKPQPELVTMEVTNEAGNLLLVHNQNHVGSATEAFIQLRQLTKVLREKRGQH
jgi:hypothetical protein